MMNYKLREMLSRVKYISCNQVISYRRIVQSFAHNPEQMAKRSMADQVAHEIADQLLRGGEWQRTAVPEGEEFRVRGYWLTYEQLYLLLEDAYSLGRTTPVGIIGVVEGSDQRKG